MKKSFIIVLLIVFASIFGFSYSKPKTDDSITVKGMIHVYGNEPFTFIGLVCETGEEYSIKADKEVLIELRNTQGDIIEIKGVKDKNVTGRDAINQMKNGTILVQEWKKVD